MVTRSYTSPRPTCGDAPTSWCEQGALTALDAGEHRAVGSEGWGWGCSASVRACWTGCPAAQPDMQLGPENIFLVPPPDGASDQRSRFETCRVGCPALRAVPSSCITSVGAAATRRARGSQNLCRKALPSLASSFLIHLTQFSVTSFGGNLLIQQALGLVA